MSYRGLYDINFRDLYEVSFRDLYDVDFRDLYEVSYRGLHAVSYRGLHEVSYRGLYEVSYRGLHEVGYRGLYEVGYRGLYDINFRDLYEVSFRDLYDVDFRHLFEVNYRGLFEVSYRCSYEVSFSGLYYCIIWWYQWQRYYKYIFIDGLSCFRLEWFYSLLSSVLWHEERDTILKSLSWSYYANPTPNFWHITWCFRSQFIFTGWEPKNFTTATTIENSTLCLELQKLEIYASMVQFQLSTDSFSKSSNCQDHLFQAWRHPHSSPISCLGFIITMVIVISFACEHKTVPNDCAPELRAK